MARTQPAPFIDSDGNAREPTPDEPLWAVRTQDFGSLQAAHAFLKQRATILRAADNAGIPRETFLKFSPDTPGFEARVVEAFGPFMRAVGLAAE